MYEREDPSKNVKPPIDDFLATVLVPREGVTEGTFL